MKGALAGAWLAAAGIVTWRQVRGGAHLPAPGGLLAVTGLFAALGLASDAWPVARPLIVITAVGLDVAGVLNLWPAGLGGQVQQAATASTSTAAPSGGGTQTT
jgi:hypothetical protein